MIGTVETRKVLTIKLERSELHNILYGEDLRGEAEAKHKNDDIPLDIVISCSCPEEKERVVTKERSLIDAEN